MKTPLQGQFKFAPTNLPESVKGELIQDKAPRYMRIALSQPVRQIGHEFSFVVLPVKLTPELVFKQCGRGVLCQTEAEAKESVELLSQQDKEHIVLAQAAGFGIVGKITNVRNLVTEQSVRSRLGQNGEKQWWALEREIDKATGEVTVLRRQDAADEAEATRIVKHWLQEYQRRKKKHFDAIGEPNTPPPPPRCKPLTPFELKDDLPAAKWTALKRQWPRSFEIFERRKANPDAKISDQECQDAYLLDLVEQGYDPKADTIRGDLNLAKALTKAAKRFAGCKKRKLTDLAIYLIAFNWELGWCYLADAEIAGKLGEILKAAFTPEQVEKYRYRTLGLVAKHLSGPSPKSP
jgi:hypothetical protein